MLMKTAVVWNKDLDEKLEKLYKLRREDIWKGIANDMGIPWRAVEDRHWDLGRKKLAKS